MASSCGTSLITYTKSKFTIKDLEMEMRNNMPSGQQSPHSRPHPSRVISNACNSQNPKINKDVEQKSKRTRRKPRHKTSKNSVDCVSNVPNNNLQNPIMAYTSSPSTSNSISYYAPEKRHTRKSLTNHQVETKYSFTIEPVTSHKAGQLIRRRNLRYKYVNLKSFVNNINRLPCIFITKLASITNLTSNLKKLSLNNRKEMTKSDLRKYPQILSQNEASTSKSGKRKREKKNISEATFSNYIHHDEVSQGLANGELTKGFVRINPKNFRDSYVNNEDTSQADYYLTSVVDRNRALEGDEVILRVKPEAEWIDGKKTATVVFITKRVHSRTTVGNLKPMPNKNSDYAIFYPRDKRIPMLRIPIVNWPNGFKKSPKLYEKTLFVARILEWVVPSYALGLLIENLGLSGDLRVESMSILREFNLDVTPYGLEVAEYLPKTNSIPLKEIKYREDIRKECVFTIDPATAKDLDDAMSVKELPNGNYEIGVHISDASFYLEEGTELDQKVSKKATTIYLVEQAYHMLPVELCMFCSLLPGQDKLSFSVFLELTEDGEIISKRFARTIMNSCAQLAYEHAQMVIENPGKMFQSTDFPNIHNGFSTVDLMRTINILQKIAVKLRERRVQNGALKIDQVKLLFDLDPIMGEPTGFCIYENKESHRLIEEFMLLANITVAERISEAYPSIAFLRCHEPPKKTMLVELQNSLSTYGIHIDISSSGALGASLGKYITDDFPGQCRAAVLNHVTAKAMTRARYFCAATMESKEEYNHYALSVPIYTHFTSPIRRYADIMVHRLLAASLGYSEKPDWDMYYVSAIATNCNIQKYNAKRAGEASGELYLAHYVEKNQPFRQDCVVVDVKDRSFDAVVLETGTIVRVYQNSCEEGTSWTVESVATIKIANSEETENSKNVKNEHEKKLLKLTVTFPKTKSLPQCLLVVEMFTTVKVLLTRKPNSYKLEATLLRPTPTSTSKG